MPPARIAEVWNSTFLPGVFEAFAGFSLAAPDDGSLLFTSNGGDAAEDGAFFGAGETPTWLSRLLEGTYPDRPRAVAGYAPVAATVPLPGGLPLLAGALGLGTVLGRRRGARSG